MYAAAFALDSRDMLLLLLCKTHRVYTYIGAIH